MREFKLVQILDFLLICTYFEAVEQYIMNFETLFRLDLAIPRPHPGIFLNVQVKKLAGLRNEIALKIVHGIIKTKPLLVKTNTVATHLRATALKTLRFSEGPTT